MDLTKGRLNELIAEYAEEILGHRAIQRFGKKFPLLIKFIDAQEPLSVQVHPNDALAQKRHNCWGKSEMWYILSATKNAALTLGLYRPLLEMIFESLPKQDAGFGVKKTKGK